MRLSILILALVTFFVFADSQQKISLRDVTALTFQEGRMTAARRTTPMPQLVQVGGVRGYTPKTVQCKNSGFDGQSIQWKCTAANIPKSIRLGHVEVVCEGYDHPGDQYILVGSCALEYTLENNGQDGGSRRKRSRRTRKIEATHVEYKNQYVNQSSGIFTIFGIIFILAMIGVCIYLSAGSAEASAGPPTSGGFQPIYPSAPQYPGSSTTFINTDNGYGSGFATGYTAGSMNNRTYAPSYQPEYRETTTTTTYDDDDDDDDTHDSTSFGGSRTR